MITCGLGAAPERAIAAATEFEASLRLGAAKLDNVFLSPPGEEVDDLAYIVSPTIFLNYESIHWDANLDYTYAWYKYSDLGVDSSYSNYRGSVTGKALDDALQLELGGDRRQVIRDPQDVIPPGQLPLSASLLDQDLYFVNPRFLRTFGGSTTLNANYVYEKVSYDDPSIQENTNQDAYFSLDNLAKESGLTWQLQYLAEETEYEISSPWRYRQASVGLGYWASRRIRLFGNIGKESPWDEPVESSMTDPFWETGFAYTARDRLRAEFAIGEREFGSTWRGDIDFIFKRGNMLFSYAERPTTIGRNGGLRLPSDGEPGGLDDFLNQPGSAETYISKLLQWSMNLEFSRGTIQLRVFDDERTGRSLPEGTQLEDQQQRGISIDLTVEPGTRTEFTVAGQFVNRRNELGDEDEFLYGIAQFGYQVTRRIKLTLDYRYSEQKPLGGSAAREYVANVVSFYVTLSL